MAGTKRKAGLDSKSESGNIQKMSKNDAERRKTEDGALEAETDSDPIIESDTTSQSGDDDGVSWPSDEDDGKVDEFQGLSEGDNEEGGVKFTAEAPLAAPAAIKAAAKDEANPTKSKDAHMKQKADRQERKAAKPNADSIARSKKLWERLRRKSHVPLDERKKLIAELFTIITGHIKDFVFKHDSVRVIQTALKYANIDQRKTIARELEGDYKTLSQSKYAKFLIGKILVHGDEETRDLVIPEFYGHIRRLMKHPEASWIVDDIYRGIATKEQKAIMLREWYGAEFALFKSNDQDMASADLQQILARHPEKKTPIMRSLLDMINLMVQKKTTGFTMLHDAMLQYFLNVQPGSEEMIEFIELVKGDEEGDLLKNLAFTKSGARFVCLALAHGTAKDRKHIIRTYKDMIQPLAYDPYGQQVLLAAYDVVDDTVLVSKTIFPPLVGKEPTSENQQQELLGAATHLKGRVPLLYPFCGKAKAIMSTEDLKLLDEIHRIRTRTSKKDPEVRRKELVSALTPHLLSLIASHAKELVSTSFGCQFITEVILGAKESREPAINAVAALASGNEEEQALFDQPTAGRMLKNLVQGGRFSSKTSSVDYVDPPLKFHELLYQRIKDDLVSWATGSNSFVVVSLLETPNFSKAGEIRKTLSKPEHRQRLVNAARVDAYERESAEVRGKGKKAKGQRQAQNSVTPSGNRGSRILLEKLDSEQ